MEIQIKQSEVQQISYNSIQLQSLQLNNLYLFAKKIIYKFSNPNLEKEIYTSLKVHILKIIKFVVSKIENHQKINLQKFVVYISIFSYVYSMLESQKIMLELSEQFYNNVRYYIEQITAKQIEILSQKQSVIRRGNLSILLCCLSSLIKQQKLEQPRIDIKKIITPQVTKKLLLLKLPNTQKLMKYYKSIILYLTKIKLPLSHRELLIKSIFYHFTNCPSFYLTQLASIHCLNCILQDKKMYNKVDSILVEQQKNKVLQICFDYLGKCNQQKQFNMIVDLVDKLLRKVENIPQNVINGTKFLFLYQTFNKKFGNPQKLSHFLQKILNKMDSNACFFIYKKISDQQQFSISKLEIINQCTKKMTEQFLFYILNSNKWQTYLSLSKVTSITHFNYKKYLLQKIINNIIKKSQSNSSLHSVLKNLAEYGSL